MSRLLVEADLVWEEDQRFHARVGERDFVLDGRKAAGPSPVDVLAAGLACCMAIDLAHILSKGRQPLKGLRATLVGGRDETDPKRLRSVDLHFVVAGDVEKEKVERAIELSRSTYCSVWHSLRQDIEFRTTFEILPGSTARPRR